MKLNHEAAPTTNLIFLLIKSRFAPVISLWFFFWNTAVFREFCLPIFKPASTPPPFHTL